MSKRQEVAVSVRSNVLKRMKYVSVDLQRNRTFPLTVLCEGHGSTLFVARGDVMDRRDVVDACHRISVT